MRLPIPAQAEFLVERAGCDAQQQQTKNPNESVDEQLRSPLPLIPAKKLDASAAHVATQLFRSLKTRFSAFADRTPRKIISREGKAWQFMQSLADFAHSARVTHIVLRQRGRESPYRSLDRRAGNYQDFRVLRFHRLRKNVVRSREQP